MATDLGDLDGDLEWVLSSFGGGRWESLLGDGSCAWSEAVPEALRPRG